MVCYQCTQGILWTPIKTQIFSLNQPHLADSGIESPCPSVVVVVWLCDCVIVQLCNCFLHGLCCSWNARFVFCTNHSVRQTYVSFPARTCDSTRGGFSQAEAAACVLLAEWKLTMLTPRVTVWIGAYNVCYTNHFPNEAYNACFMSRSLSWAHVGKQVNLCK